MKRWVLAATILGSAMAFIDTTVVNVALPVMQRELRADVGTSQWVIDSYLLVLSALILAGGALGDRIGRVRVFAAGVVVFAIASIWCGAAPSAQQLIAARALQGAGAALLVPGSLAIIAQAFAKEERGRAIGTWSSLTSLSIIAGPLLGGVLVQTVSWRAVFLINAPIAAAVLWIVWRRVDLEEQRTGGAIDWLGTILVTLALGAITFAFIEKVWPALIGGGIAFIAFLLVERRASNPIIPFSLFRSRSFTGANLLTLLLYAALSAATFLLPFNLIQAQGYSPAEAGGAMLPFVASMSLMSRWTGALADRIGPRPLLIVGPLLAAGGLALLARPGIGGSYWTTFFPAVLVLGIGMAITVAPLTTTVMTSIEDERHAGAASGINNAVARVAGLLAVAILGAVAVAVFSRDLDARLARLPVPAAMRPYMAAKAEQLGDARAPQGSPYAPVVDRAVKESFVTAFRVNVLASAALAALSVSGALLVKRPSRS
ncbi:MAG TPA: MFS transporter [Thermoanaerobaculia bacterium]|nr:MFS transporter [Thermoanaerobaculia bacterium]